MKIHLCCFAKLYKNMSTVHNPNAQKYEDLANNVKYHLRSDFHLLDDEIPKKEVHSIPESLVTLERYEESEYADGEGVYGTIFDEVAPSDKVLWVNKKKSFDNSIIDINDMIELLNEAKQKYGEDARLGFWSDFDERSEYSNCPDEYSYGVQVYHDVPETWEAYYDRLKKFRDDLEKKSNKKIEEDALIKEFAPDITINMLSESERRELLLSIYRIKAIQKNADKYIKSKE